MQERGFSSHNSYSLSKLASQFFTRDLAEIVRDRGLTANCLDPGTVNTKMLLAGWGPCGLDIQVRNIDFGTIAEVLRATLFLCAESMRRELACPFFLYPLGNSGGSQNVAEARW